ncbi:hypothetical protein FACS189491_08980 [Spirochaetia bacterium]|nr:hypothetical protein FACS189491_08980 [Spirochaetia bacterium]
MKPADIVQVLERMPIEEKLRLLSETDKAYVLGYIDKAVIDFQKLKGTKRRLKATINMEHIN